MRVSSLVIKKSGSEKMRVNKSSGKRYFVKSCGSGGRAARSIMLSTVKSAFSNTAGSRRSRKLTKRGITFLASDEQTRETKRNASGESEMPYEPMASIKKPATIPDATAVA